MPNKKEWSFDDQPSRPQSVLQKTSPAILLEPAAGQYCCSCCGFLGKDTIHSRQRGEHGEVRLRQPARAAHVTALPTCQLCADACM
jgi:hypothetical protein